MAATQRKKKRSGIKFPDTYTFQQTAGGWTCRALDTAFNAVGWGSRLNLALRNFKEQHRLSLRRK